MNHSMVAAAVVLLLGSALTSVALAQGGVAASAAPSVISSSPTMAAPMPTAAAPAPTVHTAAQPAAAQTSAPLSPVDHAAWISSRPADATRLPLGAHVLLLHRVAAATPAAPSLVSAPPVASGPIPQAASRPEAHRTPGAAAGSSPPSDGSRLGLSDHVLILHPVVAATGPSLASAPPAPGPIPQAASRPEPHQTLGAVAISSPVNSAPSAQPQPAAQRTPGLSAVAAGSVPSPAATPGLSRIDHVLMVSVHPPGAYGAPAAGDHVPAPGIDHQADAIPNYGAGVNMLAALHLPARHQLSEGEKLLRSTADSSCMDPSSWSVVVRKSAYLVDVLYKGRPFASFPAVFGRNPDHSAKMWEGDLRTPEGFYIIVQKYYNPRWRWFLRLSYPNYEDHTRYETMLDRGLVPVINGHTRSLGGAIGIHGTDRPRFNRTRINWTLGCISVDNDAIDELDQILPVGTLVIIKP